MVISDFHDFFAANYEKFREGERVYYSLLVMGLLSKKIKIKNQNLTQDSNLLSQVSQKILQKNRTFLCYPWQPFWVALWQSHWQWCAGAVQPRCWHGKDTDLKKQKFQKCQFWPSQLKCEGLDPNDFHLELMDFTQENGNENMGVILDLPANTS